MPARDFSMLAGRGGHLPVLRWLEEQQMLFADSACHAVCAAGERCLPVLVWLVSNTGFQPDALCCVLAASKGSLSTLQWLFDHGAPLEAAACEPRAPYYGSVAIRTRLSAQL
jgi:hypothetical protein